MDTLPLPVRVRTYRAGQCRVACTPSPGAKAKLRHMKVELTDLIEALPGLGWTACPDGQAEFLNQRWLDYTGMTAERAAGPGWTEAIHPDDRTGLLEHWQSCVASGAPVDAEARMRRYDGVYRWFLLRANPLRDEAGKIS